ncbi:pentatricopeptide repeat-containing protein At3g25210, mitochondrial [Magnolia sinica]|uniref:pentatricopeptide repeat-containing protein At3g25210, mitochondrial n=1 Tax=Magnolia sinica TaxID=86752 RepID=UPI0026584F44|nr:pentatricopeptide repeat-containing protein At3g25210, mitochondrial [Magnolia sinica]
MHARPGPAHSPAYCHPSYNPLSELPSKPITKKMRSIAFSSFLRSKTLSPLSLFSSPARLFTSQNPNPNPRTRTPLEKQFDSWTARLRPGFTPSDVISALRSQTDPDLAVDIFRWTALQRGYRHSPAVYHTIFDITASARRSSHAEALIDEVLAGACSPDPDLYNSMIRFCCRHRHLFNRSFDVFKKMQRSDGCKPSLETYSMLLNSLLRRFNRLNVSYVYLHAVRSLLKQMKASGVIPDTFTLNLIVKAYSKCLEMDEAIRVFREMGLYGCTPDGYTYSYLTKGLCEKERVAHGFGFYQEMRGKGFVPTSSTYMILICSLSMERRFEDGIDVLFDMLDNSMVPDVLTYRTLLEGLCREGRENDAFGLLEELRKKEGSMGERVYSSLLDGLHLLR